MGWKNCLIPDVLGEGIGKILSYFIALHPGSVQLPAIVFVSACHKSEIASISVFLSVTFLLGWGFFCSHLSDVEI